jgi:phosphatidylserine/phosphatidylglycerophosphate/cardiolipin synthase-like enzyme
MSLQSAVQRLLSLIALTVLAGCAQRASQPDRPASSGTGWAQPVGNANVAPRLKSLRREARAAAGLPSDKLWRHAHSRLYLSAEGPAPGAVPFRFPGLQAEKTSVAITSLAKCRLAVTGRCNGPVRLRRTGGSHPTNRVIPAGTPLTFVLCPWERERTRLEIDAATTVCDLTVTPGRSAGYVIRLEREETANPTLARFDTRQDTCRMPGGSDPLAAVFHSDRWLSQTGPLAFGRPVLLTDAREAFLAKVEALSGARLSDAAFEAGDPTMPLDFSRAPQLELIYISCLLMRADFSGYLMARMVAFHAARGTTVRILVTDGLMLRRDRSLYESLAARFPNVQLQSFRWRPDGMAWPTDQIHRIHRAHHVKIFATLSPHRGRSRLILGGRNLHDGFVFDRPRDLSSIPFLRNYDMDKQITLNFFAAYEDLEIGFSQDDTVQTIAAQLSSYWHRDYDTQVARPFSVSQPGAAPTGVIRHFISVPYNDGQALEQLYVELLDAACHRVDLVTPFLNLTPRIEAALRRALDRGVEVDIVSRIKISEPAGIFVSSLNRLFVADYADRLTVSEYQPTPRMLHSKIILVDGRLAVVTSANLNHRSFMHDTENGILILDEALTAQLSKVVQNYREHSRRLGTKVDVPPLMRILLSPQPVRNLF